jgi:GTP cyclohydrolase I
MPKADDELRQLRQVLEIPAGREWEHAIRLVLRLMGEDPDREGLRRTPLRVKRSLQFLASGYRQDPARILNRSFRVKQDEMVIVKDIDIFSMCEHHLLPFVGKCHVAYMPKDRIIGLSKIPRLVDAFARRLQVQERLTTQIAEALTEHLQPLGAACVIEAYHLCMMMRGVQKQNSYAISSAMIGEFQDDPKTRAEFMQLIQHARETR